MKIYVKIWKFMPVIIFVIFFENYNLGLKMDFEIYRNPA